MSAKLFLLGWKVVDKLPEFFVRTVAMLASDLLWLRRGKGVRQLERNLYRVRPGMNQRAMRRLSRMGMRFYTRYYVDALRLRTFSDAQIRARCRVEGMHRLQETFASNKSAVLGLAHMGNWDLAGRFASLEISPVTTVAERLEPPELFDEFVSLREDLGLEIFALGEDGLVRKLLNSLRNHPRIVPLLFDRDLSDNGVEVEFFGESASMAKGPAVLALAGKSPLFPISLYHERLRGKARRAAGSPWGMVLVVHEEVKPDLESGVDQVQSMTQRCAAVLAETIADRPWEWHMLQKVFTSDLNQSALER